MGVSSRDATPFQDVADDGVLAAEMPADFGH